MSGHRIPSPLGVGSALNPSGTKVHGINGPGFPRKPTGLAPKLSRLSAFRGLTRLPAPAAEKPIERQAPAIASPSAETHQWPRKIDTDRFFIEYAQSFPGKSEALGAVAKDNLRQLLGFLSNDTSLTDLRWAAYLLATVRAECGIGWKPIEENKALVRRNITHRNRKTGKLEAWYGTPVRVQCGGRTVEHTYFGRGYVQLTHKDNYQAVGKLINRDLVCNPALALVPATAYHIMSLCMVKGLAFTHGRKFSDYIKGANADYENARRMVNGLDRSIEIAKYAKTFEELLRSSSDLKQSSVSANHPASINEREARTASPRVTDKVSHAAAVVKLPPTSELCLACSARKQFGALKDRAAFASDAYRNEGALDPSALPNGARRLTLKELKKLGFSERMTNDPESGFAASVYDYQGKYIVAFRGTEPLSGSDWMTNVKQALGFETDQYQRAMNLANKMSKVALRERKEIEFVGHSLGGGLASAAAMVTGHSATTFNPAGLNENTITRRGLEFDPKVAPVNNFVVDGEILNDTQNPSMSLPSLTSGALSSAATSLLWKAATGAAWGPVGAIVGVAKSLILKWGIGTLLPDPVGTTAVLPKSGMAQRVPGVGGIAGHLMGAVDGGIEKLRSQNEEKIKYLGGSCDACG